MLTSTGYFRGVECPFRESCRRPYCHFRHRGRGTPNVEGGEARNSAEYDPYSPELPNASVCLDDEFSRATCETCHDTLELERVNKAIEEAKSEVEREQRKYEELLELQKGYIPSLNCAAKSVNCSHLEYSPNSSGSGTLCYSPTILFKSAKTCKYTLEYSKNEIIKNNCMEYIPTAIPKHISKKYIIDNSKPSTDMEYDPMSNYSSRLLNKASHQKVSKSHRDKDEVCAPHPKKVRRKSSDLLVEATFSDSEDNSTSHLYLNKSFLLNAVKDKFEAEYSVDCNVDGLPKKCKSKDHAMKVSHEDFKCEKKELVTETPLCADAYHRKGSSKELKKTKKSLSGVADIKKRKKSDIDKKSRKEILQSYKKTKKNGILSEKNARWNTDIAAVKNEQSQSKAKKDKTKFSFKELGHEAKNKVKNIESSQKPEGPVILKSRTMSHVDLFGDESSDDDKELKTCMKSYSPCEKITKITSASRRSSTSSHDSSEIDYSILEKNLDSDPDPMEECLRIFNESLEVKTEDKGRKGKKLNEDPSEDCVQNMTVPLPGQKRRISHIKNSTNADLSSKHFMHPYRHPTPQEICYQRIQRAQEQAAQLLSQKKCSLPEKKSQKSIRPGESKRIAHIPASQSSVPIQSQLPDRKSLLSTQNGLPPVLKFQTLAGMASKTTSTSVQKRQAHVPSLKCSALKRPVIPTEYGAKVPTTIRQRYLNIFIDECLKSCISEKEAFDKALEEEKSVYSRSNTRNIYLNVAVNTLKKLRCQAPVNKTMSQKVTNKKAISHKSVVDGKLAVKTTFTVQPNTRQEEDKADAKSLYKFMKDYTLTPEQLKEHGYPFAHPEKPGKAVVFTAEEKKSPSASCRICCRCGVEYLSTQIRSSIRQEECVHHWGRLRRQRVLGGWETQYSCCSGGVGSPGCQVAKQHVHDGRKENLDGFVKTFEKLNDSVSPEVYALDCEMCYTTKGLELTRVTVINSELQVVYDTFVQPDNKIVDYNTRFSGVTEDDLENTSITLRDVQAVLLCMFSCDTILIGHSLESDLFALKLIHLTVVDTAVVFPHRLGLPYKRALRSLMADHLKRIIQDSVEGHDSSEDACACMELMLWRIKEDAKIKR